MILLIALYGSKGSKLLNTFNFSFENFDNIKFHICYIPLVIHIRNFELYKTQEKRTSFNIFFISVKYYNKVRWIDRWMAGILPRWPTTSSVTLLSYFLLFINTLLHFRCHMVGRTSFQHTEFLMDRAVLFFSMAYYDSFYPLPHISSHWEYYNLNEWILPQQQQ